MSQSGPQIPELGSEFLTVEKFKEAAQQGAKAAGFAFSVSSSKMSRVEKDGCTPFVTLQCVMGGKYRNNHEITEETRKRVKFTKRQSCLVSLRATLNENTGVWVVSSYKSQHNHEPLSSTQVHCLHQHQVFNKEQKELVHLMLKTEGSHSGLKKAIEAASGLEQVFSHIDRAFRQHKLQTNRALGLNIISADPFILNNKRFEQLLGKISKWTINKIKKEICEIKENDNNEKNNHCELPLLSSSSQSIDIAVNKALYKLEEKYKTLSDSGSKATLLQKIEALAIEENIIPKAPLR
ncbi:19475_t:CDS:2 [Racocetra fulgida]|uniref:19475_t:CDS:1 n=1 Tax=Racocetra fulgida TaxID=60492 RepID=A0A9N9G6F8_9GLOM|nr:19475_t:CDS:2 [Racocetra fulgida]